MWDDLAVEPGLRSPSLSQVTTVGHDLAKRVFQVHAITTDGTIVVRRQLRRSEVLKFFSALPPCLIGMEACASAHYWGRALLEFGPSRRSFTSLPPRSSTWKPRFSLGTGITRSAGAWPPFRALVPSRPLRSLPQYPTRRSSDRVGSSRLGLG